MEGRDFGTIRKRRHDQQSAGWRRCASGWARGGERPVQDCRNRLFRSGEDRSGSPLARHVLAASIFLALLTGCGGPPAGKPDTPVRLAWGENRQLIVSDYQKRQVQFRDSQTFALRRSLAVNGHPLAVGYSQGKLFVGNETTQCVEVYDAISGGLLYTLGDGPGSHPIPNDLEIDETSGQIFVVDTAQARVTVYAISGPLLYTITDPLLSKPASLSLDIGNRQLYVSNVEDAYLNNINRVLVFSLDGTQLRSFTGTYFHPKGLSIAADGRLYLADTLAAQVLILDPANGNELGRLGEPIVYGEPHRMPFDTLYDVQTKRLLVTDHLLGKVVVYPVEAAP